MKISHCGDIHVEEDRYFGDTAQCLEWFVEDSIQANTDLFVVDGDLTTYTYKGNFGLAAKLGHTVDAFRIVETARGRSIADPLRRPRPQEGELSEGEKAARAEFNNLQRTLMDTSDRVQRGALLDKLLVAEHLMGAQAPPINALQGATLQAHPVDLAKLRTVLLPDEVLLEYVLADPTSFCLVIDQKRAVIVSLPAGQKAIEEATDHYLNQVEAGKRDNTDARELYDVLLGPVRQLPRTARLTIVPDGTLWRLPIETLRGPDGKYVLQSHTVSYAPSSTVLYYLRTLRRPLQPQMAFLGVGSVPYDLGPKEAGPGRGIMRAVSRGVYDVSGTHLYRLPASRQEVVGAERSLNHPSLSVLLLDANATESKFKSQPLGDFKILHFAVHGVSSPQFPERAARRTLQRFRGVSWLPSWAPGVPCSLTPPGFRCQSSVAKGRCYPITGNEPRTSFRMTPLMPQGACSNSASPPNSTSISHKSPGKRVAPE